MSPTDPAPPASTSEGPVPPTQPALAQVTTAGGILFLLAFAWFFLASDKRFDDPMPLVYLGVGILLLLSPHIKTFKFANLIEIERQVAEAKQEAKQTREEVRNSIQALTARLEARATATVNNNMYVVSREEFERSRHTIENLERRQRPGANLMMARHALDLNDLDPQLALARVRMVLERVLRMIMRRPTTTVSSGRYMGLSSLVKAFLAEHPDYNDLLETFRLVGDAANAAIHGQRVEPGVAREAIQTGERLIELLARDFGVNQEELL